MLRYGYSHLSLIVVLFRDQQRCNKVISNLELYRVEKERVG